MSPKSSIKYKDHTDDGPGYYLYDDGLDRFEDEQEQEPPVYLRLDGVHVELMTFTDVAGASVTVILPRAMAREFGLLTQNVERSGLAPTQEGR